MLIKMKNLHNIIFTLYMYKSSKISDRFLCTMLAEVQNLHENNGGLELHIGQKYTLTNFLAGGKNNFFRAPIDDCLNMRYLNVNSTRQFMVCYTDPNISLEKKRKEKKIEEKIYRYFINTQTKRFFSFFKKLRLHVHNKFLSFRFDSFLN